ncbi:FkbM family methyltransferase [Bacteroidota bacterium]
MLFIWKKLISFKKYFKKTNRELIRIQRIKRFSFGQTSKLFTNSVYFADSLSFIWQYNEIFQEEIYKFKNINPNPVIIDCGANIGLSIIFFKINYPNSHVIAFEPNPKIFKICEKNIASFGIENVELYNFALANREDKLLLNCEDADGSFLTENISIDTVTVKSVRLSNYINTKIELLKIDIEGAEYQVIKEVESKLELVSNIFIEYHSRFDKNQELHLILDILSKQGYRYYITGTGIINSSPFIKRDLYNNYDNFLNIHAYRI